MSRSDDRPQASLDHPPRARVLVRKVKPKQDDEDDEGRCRERRCRRDRSHSHSRFSRDGFDDARVAAWLGACACMNERPIPAR
jgi:hypothetical protein